MDKRQNKYIPTKGSNPAILGKKIEKLQKELNLHGKNIDAISKSHDTHITMLSNFARHDIKNSIQSIDSVVSTNSADEISEEHLKSIKLNLKIMRETIDNFSKLVPHSNEGEFSYSSLITAIELLNRDDFYENKINFEKEDSLDVEVYFSLPFQSVVQMINNIIINAVKSLMLVDVKRKIKVTLTANDEHVCLNIYDNGEKIDNKIEDKIFEYGISTTGGSGIGLFHAKYLCELYEGSISSHTLENSEFVKYFSISLPIKKTE